MTLDQEAVIHRAFEMPPLPQSTVRLVGLVTNDDAELEAGSGDPHTAKGSRTAISKLLARWFGQTHPVASAESFAVTPSACRICDLKQVPGKPSENPFDE